MFTHPLGDDLLVGASMAIYTCGQLNRTSKYTTHTTKGVNNKATTPKCNFHFKNYKTVHVLYKQHVKGIRNQHENILIYMKTYRFQTGLLVRSDIRKSVDSLCRDGADTPMPPCKGKAFTRTNVERIEPF